MTEEDPTAEVTADEWYTACQRWHDFWHQDRHYNQKYNFINFLGVVEPIKAKELPDKKGPLASHFVVQVGESAAKKIRLLNGPYHHALLTAYRIRKCQTTS